MTTSNEQEPQDPEATLVSCGKTDSGKWRCCYTWEDGSQEMFVEGEHPIHKKGLGRIVRPSRANP